MRQEASLASGKPICQDCGTLAVVTLSRSPHLLQVLVLLVYHFDLKKVCYFLASASSSDDKDTCLLLGRKVGRETSKRPLTPQFARLQGTVHFPLGALK